MQRRKFLAATAASAFVLGGQEAGAKPQSAAREYYQLRRYEFRNGPQEKQADAYLRDALIPAANRLGVKPVGVFSVMVGAMSPTRYVLLPSDSLETVVMIDARLASDEEYMRTAAPFLSAPAQSPAYVRMEGSLMAAFEGWPHLKLPAATAKNGPRVFEMRTYESPSDADHVRKVEMFNQGEFDIFGRAGFESVFYGDTLIGSRLPNLTYMLSFGDLADRGRLWSAFGNSPDWKKLSSSTRYAFEEIVSNITNVILGPTAYSQV